MQDILKIIDTIWGNMAILMSPEEVWANITIECDNFDEKISKEYELEHGFYKEIFFNGMKTEMGITRVFSILAYPKKVQNAPVVLVCNDPQYGIDRSRSEERRVGKECRL